MGPLLSGIVRNSADLENTVEAQWLVLAMIRVILVSVINARAS